MNSALYIGDATAILRKLLLGLATDLTVTRSAMKKWHSNEVDGLSRAGA